MELAIVSIYTIFAIQITKSMKYVSILLFTIVLVFISCSSISIVEPIFERIEDVDIIEISRKKLRLNAFLVLNNPNSFALDLAQADLKALVDDIVLAKIDQTYDTKMPANSEFKMPITIDMDLEKLYQDNPLAALGKGLQIMSDKKLNVHFIGTIKVGKGSVKISVPIDQVEVVNF